MIARLVPLYPIHPGSSGHSCLPAHAEQRVTRRAGVKRRRRVAPWLAVSKGYSPSHKGDILALLKGDILALG